MKYEITQEEPTPPPVKITITLTADEVKALQKIISGYWWKTDMTTEIQDDLESSFTNLIGELPQ